MKGRKDIWAAYMYVMTRKKRSKLLELLKKLNKRKLQKHTVFHVYLLSAYIKTNLMTTHWELAVWS